MCQVKVKKSVEVVRAPHRCNHAIAMFEQDAASELCTAVLQPAPVRGFVDTVLRTPVADLAGVLESFSWSYEKVRAVAAGRLQVSAAWSRRACVRSAQGDFHHWVALFNHFDALFDELLKPRADLALRYDQAEAKADPPFPSSTVVAVLRVTATILENCSNKHLYHSYDVRPHAPTCLRLARLPSFTDVSCVRGQHLTSLLAAPDPDVVAATLQALVAFVRKTHVSSVRWHGNAGLNDRLLALSEGWGGKEEVRIAASAPCAQCPALSSI